MKIELAMRRKNNNSSLEKFFSTEVAKAAFDPFVIC